MNQSSTSKIHPEILDKDRLELLKKLKPFLAGFVMAGGTALALQIKHRQSFDFDFFSQNEISTRLAEKIALTIKINKPSTNNQDELTFLDSREIKVSFIHYPFKPRFDLVETELANLYGVKDIAAQKAYTIGRRGTYRDYFDLYSIISRGYAALPEIIKICQEIYGDVFNPKLLLEQLVYFDDILSFKIDPVDDNPLPSVETIKEFFESEIKGVIASNGLDI